jgi:DNA-binding HxlR family transcriptional regulator
MLMAKLYGLACPVAKTLDIVGERWTLLIIRDLLKLGPRKFQDFEESLGIAPGILSDRLKVLEEEGIIARGFYSTHPPRAEYTLTPKGRELRIVVGALAVWGSMHVHPESALVHDVCGTPVDVGYYCAECDRRVRNVRLHKSHHEDTARTKGAVVET